LVNLLLLLLLLLLPVLPLLLILPVLLGWVQGLLHPHEGCWLPAAAPPPAHAQKAWMGGPWWDPIG
jgi:hypothetical protein